MILVLTDVLMSDDLSMKALAGGFAERAKKTVTKRAVILSYIAMATLPR